MSRYFSNAELVVHENEPPHWFDDAAMAKASERQQRLYFMCAREQVTPYKDRTASAGRAVAWPWRCYNDPRRHREYLRLDVPPSLAYMSNPSRRDTTIGRSFNALSPLCAPPFTLGFHYNQQIEFVDYN